MKRMCIGLITVMLVPTASLADGRYKDQGYSNEVHADCGGDAYTFAEVVSPPEGAPRRGPVVTVPDTLCADLSNQGARVNDFRIYVDIGRNTDSATDRSDARRTPRAYQRHP